MRYKRSVKLFFIIALLLILPLPAINSLHSFIMNGVFPQNKKEFFSSDVIESYKNYFMYINFHKSPKEKNVIVGKDDFLFLGNGHNRVLDETCGIFRPREDEILLLVSQIKHLQEWYEKRGIKFILSIAPNKHTLYREKLPDTFHYAGKTFLDDFVTLSVKSGIHILDLRNILLQKKTTAQDSFYFKTDTHWNTKGASIAFEETVNFLNATYLQNIEAPKYSLFHFRKHAGDLANFMKITELLGKSYEEDFTIVFEKPSFVCKGDLYLSTGEAKSCTTQPNPILNRTGAFYIVNADARNKYKVLFLSDSFGIAPSQLFNATFEKVWKWHYKDLFGMKLETFIATNQPDIVIYQVLERLVYDNRAFITSLPLAKEQTHEYSSQYSHEVLYVSSPVSP